MICVMVLKVDHFMTHETKQQMLLKLDML